MATQSQKAAAAKQDAAMASRAPAPTPAQTGKANAAKQDAAMASRAPAPAPTPAQTGAANAAKQDAAMALRAAENAAAIVANKTPAPAATPTASVTYYDDIANYNWHEGFNTPAPLPIQKPPTPVSNPIGGGSGGGGNRPPPPPPPPPATPDQPLPPTLQLPLPVRTAPIDTVLFNDDTVPIEIMADLIFENIGGQELIDIARNDIVNGQEVSYQPIKNLSSIQQQYNPNNIVSLQATADKYFNNFAIKLEKLKTRYYSLTQEEEEFFDKIFKKYL
jgi:hypothetical protein